MRRRVRSFAFAFSALVAGCTYLVDTSNLSGKDGGAPSASTSADGSTTSFDAGDAGDAGTLDATDSETRADGDSATISSSCPGNPAAFCDDFEHAGIAPPWSDVSVAGKGASLSIQGGLATSPSRALVASLTPDSGACNYALAEKTLTGSFHGYHLAFSVYVEPFSGSATLASPFIGAASDRCYTYLFDQDNTLLVYGQHAQGANTVAEASFANAGTLVTGRWVRVEFDYDFATQSVSVALDGASKAASLAFDCPLVPGAATVQLGLSCENDPPDVRRLHFDDVTFSPR